MKAVTELLGICSLIIAFNHDVCAQICAADGLADPSILAQQLSGVLDTEPREIPLVFHILHDGNLGVIAEADISTQIAILNGAFLPTGYSFFLAAIHRVNDANRFTIPDLRRIPDDLIGYTIDTFHSINIFVGDIAPPVLGWSPRPGTDLDFEYGSNRSGVLLDFTVFYNGSDQDFKLGDTLVHEVGHYMGLRHPWDDKMDCDDGDADLVGDTPRCKEGHSRLTCSSSPATWPDTCPNHPGSDPLKNFMMYTSDVCRSEFTNTVPESGSQVGRMKAIVPAYLEFLGGHTLDLPSGLSIASNQNLSFHTGTTLRMGSGTSITVSGDGILSLLGTAAFRVRVEPASATWNGIYLTSGAFASLNYTDLVDVSGSAGGAAVRVTGSTTRASLYESTIDVNPGSYVFGVSDSGAYYYVPYGLSIYRSTITSASGPAVYTNGSGGVVTVSDSRLVQSSSYAAVRADGGSITAYDHYVNGLNRISGGRLSASGGGVIYFGTDASMHSGNHFCDGPASSLEGTSGGVVYAKHNKWYTNPPAASGTVEYDPAFSAPDCSASKGFVPLEGSSLGVAPDLESDLFRAFALEHDGKLDEALALFLEVARAGQDPDASAALLEYGRLARTLKRSDAVEALRDLSAHDAARNVKAERVLAPLLASLGRFDEALSLLESLEKEYAGTADGFFATLDRIYLLIELDRSNEAVSLLNGIQTRTDEETLALAAVTWQLRADGYDALERALPDPDREDRVATDETTQLEATAYPSPFNPTTTVVFDLAGRTSVDVAVYDALGRRLASLARGVFEAGRHETSWNAAGHPSGMYFIVIRADGALRTLPVTLSK